MAKIPFTLEAWLKDKSQKVETRDGRLVHNIWQVKEPPYTNNRKAEVCALIDGEEDALVIFEGGRYLPTTKDTDSPFDLFIITPEPELTDWEGFISGCLQKHGLLDCGAADRIAKECSAELLDLANKELKKHEFAIFTREEFDAEIEEAKAEALKDLPRWKESVCVAKIPHALIKTWHGECRIGSAVEPGDKYITLGMLEKLPGFKED